MKNILWLLLLLANIALATPTIAEYPMAPIPELTPGELCDQPDRYRYPEQIPYCERNVTVEQKEQVFYAYRRSGYRLSADKRSSYKIDHFIPLCAGGSNNNRNLWPQHLSISEVTDSIEQMGCAKMMEGRLSQRDFVQLIMRVKRDLSQARNVRSYLNNL